MIVIVVDREQILPQARTIEISDFCPKCGARRGDPEGFNFFEDGTTYHVNTWTNPCGHIDQYEDCLKEAKELKQKKNS